jgi:hypothetical protein
MLRLIADEDFDGRIVRGLFRRLKNADLVRVQDVGLSGASDDKLLEWAADNNRILLTHDKRTMPGHVQERVTGGLEMPGVFIVSDSASIGHCIDDLQLIIECSDQGEWANVLIYLPFRD